MALPVSRLVRAQINLSPLAAAPRSFGILNIAGDSGVINGLERFRTYTTYEGVIADFGVNAPEAKGAQLYFSQVPKPNTLMISRWLRVASAGFNQGSILSATEQLIATWNAITSGGINITIDGVAKVLTGLNFSASANLNAVAAVIDAALTGATVTWTGSRFLVTSDTTGIASIVSYATVGGGTDISGVMKLTAAASASLVPGYAAESPAAYTAVMVNKSPLWYGLVFAASTQPTDNENLAVAAVIEPLDLRRLFGITITNTNVLDAAVTNDLASQLSALNYKSTFTQYSQNLYAVCSLFGRMFSVNFAANRSTITLMYKQEPGVTGEELTTTQADTLKAKHCNVFVNYVNSTVIIQYGVVANGSPLDEVHGLDWLQDQIQTNVYNSLYTSKTKIPQTDNGVNILVNSINAALDQGVNNGLIAPGVWNADGFGQLQAGDFLKSGYYVYAQSVALQSQADREARKAPPIIAAVKLAGAIQEVDILINVNR